MISLKVVVLSWFLLTLFLFIFAWFLAAIMKYLNRDLYEKPLIRDNYSQVHVLTPVKGAFSGLGNCLGSILEQDYPDFKVTFIVESEDDQAFPILEELCQNYGHANLVVAGMASGLGQKNHNLIKGVESIQSPPDILVFCDSTNEAKPDWLKCLTARIDQGTLRVVTTFRSFDPEPPTLGGVCQAIYATSVSTIAPIQNSPWGGGTAIKWELFEEMRVVEAWSDNVIDDLTLGNCLLQAREKVIMDLDCMMKTRLDNQGVSACMAYLDRQIMFPKFTNPLSIWAPVILILGNVGIAVMAAIILLGFSLSGLVSGFFGLVSLGLLLGICLVGVYLKKREPQGVNPTAWALWFFPSIFIISFISIRSIFRNHITWGGKIYYCRNRGVVVRDEPWPR